MPKKNKNKNKFKVQWFRDQKNFVLLLQLKLPTMEYYCKISNNKKPRSYLH